MKLTTEEELAEEFGLSLDELRDLRQRQHWPHVRLSRFKVRFTDVQIAEIIASRTVKPKRAASQALSQKTGLTERSAARSA